MIHRVRLLILAAFFLAAAAHAQTTALAAMKALPKDAAKNLARIEARDGTAQPERWHFLIHDPAAENGLREYVVAAGKLAASRTLSQFAESIEAADVIGSDALKTDTDRALVVVLAFAKANGIEFATLDFALVKYGEPPAPSWKVACMDAAGNELAHVVVSAVNGAVIAHHGFPAEPPPAALAAATPKPGAASKPKAVPVAKAVPAATPKPGLFKRIFGGEKPKEP